MTEPKDPPSFLRKVARFVANPTTEWSEISGSRTPEDSASGLDKAELKAMIERKRRNDFVRKRELDLLRKMRREGLTPEQLASLGSSSRLDDSDLRLPEGLQRQDAAVKDKIDHIEREMVGDPAQSMLRAAPPRHSGFFSAPTLPGVLPSSVMRHAREARMPAGRSAVGAGPSARPDGPAAPSRVDTPPPRANAPTAPQFGTRGAVPSSRPELPPLWPSPPDVAAPRRPDAAAARTLGPATEPPGLPHLDFAPTEPPPTARAAVNTSHYPFDPALTPPDVAAPARPLPAVSGSLYGMPPAAEVHEIAHDPELDEAVIAFAGADFDGCERSLKILTAPNGERADHAETWLALLDLYRATGRQAPFEALAADYAQHFGWSAPQWISLPELVAQSAHRVAASGPHGGAGGTAASAPLAPAWAAPISVDIEAVARLRAQSLQMPMPWVLDWSQLEHIDPQAATQLSALFRLWSGQALQMQWVGVERLLATLAGAAPTGVRDADPCYWLLRLDVLRLVNRPDRFDEAAIDYCMTYEVSPPSWEPTRCTVRTVSAAGAAPSTLPSSNFELSSSFVEPSLMPTSGAHAGERVAQVELNGQLVGDITRTLARLDEQLADARHIVVNCAQLIRLDFVAAGDLLNWVLSRVAEQRSLQFEDAHRLVALFFGAMGITEHAPVTVRRT